MRNFMTFHDPLLTSWPGEREFLPGMESEFFPWKRAFFRGAMSVNLYENDKEYLVLVKTKNLKKEDLSITFEGPYLDIKLKEPGEQAQKEKMEKSEKHRFQEYASRKIRFENPINTDSVKATMENGILQVTVQKEAVKPAKSISIS